MPQANRPPADIPGNLPVKHDPYAALRIADYRFYTIGWVISLIGTRIRTAVAWDMYQRTGEALSLGLVGLAQAVPILLLALPGRVPGGSI